MASAGLAIVAVSIVALSNRASCLQVRVLATINVRVVFCVRQRLGISTVLSLVVVFIAAISVQLVIIATRSIWRGCQESVFKVALVMAMRAVCRAMSVFLLIRVFLFVCPAAKLAGVVVGLIAI
jgi:hypothetical protein